MSMIFDLRRISRDEENSLLQNSEDILFFLYGIEAEEPPRGFFQKLFGGKTPPKASRKWVEPAEDRVMSLDKNWHMIHYILAREPWEGTLPQATLLAGGEELGSVDVGYGPARLLSRSNVEEFAQYLGTLSKENFAAGITAKEIAENELYGAYDEWSADDAMALWEYIEEMREFFSGAVKNKECIILYLY